MAETLRLITLNGGPYGNSHFEKRFADLIGLCAEEQAEPQSGETIVSDVVARAGLKVV